MVKNQPLKRFVNFVKFFNLNFIITIWYLLQVPEDNISPLYKTNTIAIGAHHTVSGHEASDLAKRLNAELASQQQQHLKTVKYYAPLSPNEGNMQDLGLPTTVSKCKLQS